MHLCNRVIIQSIVREGMLKMCKFNLNNIFILTSTIELYFFKLSTHLGTLCMNEEYIDYPFKYI